MAEVVKHTPITLRLIQLESQAENALSHEARTIPSCNPYRFGLDDRVRLFGTASAAWTETYKPKKLVHVLDPRHHREPDDIVATIKRQRGPAELFKTTYLLFHENHRVPEDLNNLIAALVYVQISVAYKSHSPNAKYALKAIKAYDPQNPESCFVPCPDNSYRFYIEDELRIISQFTNFPEHFPSSFHNLRKKMREFMNMFKLAAATEIDPCALQIYNFLYRINHLMGRDHDHIVAYSMQHQTKDPDPIQLSDEERELIQHFLNSITEDR